jgi:tetratricopeptide (TPR) repeat protein
MTLNFKAVICAVVFAAMILALFPVQAQTGSSQDTLNQFVSDLQRNPGDTALREKIITLAQTLNVKPALPEEVHEIVGRANFAIKNASSEADFMAAADAYAKASLIAPWVSDYYFNQGVAYEKAGRFDQAIAAFGWYLKAEPRAKDADAVHERIGGLKYAKERATQQSIPQATAEQSKMNDHELIKSLDGAQYGGQVRGFEHKLLIRGDRLLWWSRIPEQNLPFAEPPVVMQIIGHTAKMTGRNGLRFEFTISDDGESITSTQTDPRGRVRDESTIYRYR